MSQVAVRARSAVLWNTGFNLFRDALQFLTMLVLVRLLEREAYGQFSLVTGMTGFLAILSANAFLAHLLQVRDDADVRLQDHFTAAGALGLGMLGVTNIAALGLRFVPAYAVVAPALHVMSITFLLEWPCEFRRKMLERAYDWRRLRLLHGLGLTVGAGLALAMAFNGAGVYALIVPGMVVTLPFIWDLFMVERWRPDWSWSREAYAPAIRFGITRVASAAAGRGRVLAEAAVLARVVGFASTGVFNRALGLQQMLCAKSAEQLMYALYPVLTRLDPGGESRARVNSLVLRAVAWYSVPLAVASSALAAPIVHTLYGNRWDEVVPLLPWAMLFGVAASLSQTANTLLLSIQQQRVCVVADIATLGGTLASLAIGLHYGLRGYFVGLVVAQAGILFVLLLWLNRLAALAVRGIALALAPPAAASVVALGVCRLALLPLPGQPPGFVKLALFLACFAFCYVASLRAFFRPELRELVGYVPGGARIRRLLLLESGS